MATSSLARMAESSCAGLFATFIPVVQKSGILAPPPRICGFLLKTEEFLRKSMDFQEKSKAGGLPRLQILPNPGIFLPIPLKKSRDLPEISSRACPGRLRLARNSLRAPKVDVWGFQNHKKSNCLYGEIGAQRFHCSA